MFPRLDVDFHLAPFVDPRDHVGVAAASVTIGAPHFEKPREFWVRPLRTFQINMRGDNGGRGNVLLRPVEVQKNNLLLLIDELEWRSWEDLSTVEIEPELPADWIPHSGLFARHWRHPTLPLAARLISTEYDRQARLFPLQMPQENACEYEDPLQLSIDELLDWPIERLHNSLERQFSDPRSELYLTWSWAQIPRGQRFEAFFACPEWNGFLDLMRCVLISEALRVPIIAQAGAVWQFLEDISWKLRSNSMPPKILDVTRTNAWMQAILEIYRRRETRQSTPQRMSLNHYKIHPLRCPAPTHHEMLEARLQLHAWARENLPPSQAHELIALDDLN